MTLLDAPGSADFAGAVDAALAAADLALVVVSAVDGVQAGTHAAWRLAADAGVPRMVVVTKEDKARADFRHVLADLRDGVRRRAGAARAAARRGDGVHRRRRRAHRGGPRLRPRRATTTPRRCPAGARRRGAPAARRGHRGDRRARRRPARALPVGRGADRRRSWRARSRTRSRGRRGVPRAVVSGVTGVGVDRLADLLCELGPSPADRTARVQAGQTSRSRSPPTRPARRCCTRSGRSRTRSSARSPCSACCPARSATATGCSTPRPAPRSASPGCSGCAARSTCRVDAVPGGADRRRRQAHRDPVGHPAGGADRAGRVDDRPARRASGPRCTGSRWNRSRSPTTTGSPPP